MKLGNESVDPRICLSASRGPLVSYKGTRRRTARREPLVLPKGSLQGFDLRVHKEVDERPPIGNKSAGGKPAQRAGNIGLSEA